MSPESATTTFTLEGPNLPSRLSTLIGSHIGLLTVLCERTRADAFEIMLAHAERLGANAVIGLRYDATR
jgi:uncharacterized protein YbjQ (UPF0145 family)